jgi:replicative superfamily II helicase
VIGKMTFFILLILFFLLSFYIDLPPGIIVTDFLEFPFQYSTLLTNNTTNALFFSTIIAGIVYLINRNKKLKKSQITRLDLELHSLIDEKIETDYSDLTKIKGIGFKRAIELELAGVKNISDLAKRSPQHLAEKTGISISLISNWIIQANKYKK